MVVKDLTVLLISYKQSVVQGLNGSISLTAGTRQENESLNLNYRKRNFGINALISGNVRLLATTKNENEQFLKISIDTLKNTELLKNIHQKGPSHIARLGYESGIGFDWSPSQFNNFTGGIGYDYFRKNSFSSLEDSTFQIIQVNPPSILTQN